MRTGYHARKELHYAACFVLVQSPKKDEFGDVIADGKEGHGLERVPRKSEVAYWSNVSVEHAVTCLKDVIAEKDYGVDEERTADVSEVMDLEKAIERFADADKAKEELKARKAAEDAAREKARLAAEADREKAKVKAIAQKEKAKAKAVKARELKKAK